MKPLFKGFCNNALCLTVFASSLLFLFGWAIDNKFLKSVNAAWVTMKPVTIVLFMISSAMIFLIDNPRSMKESNRQVFISFLTFCVLCILCGLCRESLETLINGHDQYSATSKPLFPSYITIFCFFLVGIRGLIYLFTSNIKPLVRTFGFIISTIGISGVIGYLMDIPFMYFDSPRFFTGLAFQTSVLFAVLGTALLNEKRCTECHENNVK